MVSLLECLRHPPRVWLVNLLLWGGAGALVGLAFWLTYGRDRADFDPGESVLRMVCLMGSYAFLAPCVFRWASRSIWSIGWWRWIAPAALAISAFILAHGALYMTGRVLVGVGPTRPFLEAIMRWIPWGGLLIDIPVFVGIVGLAQTRVYRTRLNEKELEAVELRRQLVEAQLAALRAQLQPHFLFNTLHTIGVFTRKDPDQANRILALVGDVLRRSLETVRTQEITLREEMEFLKPYLEIQRTRFHDRLTVDVAIDVALLGCRVPSFVLQPLVENAVRHGFELHSGKGVIRITARRDEEQLVLEVLDDGAGLAVPVGAGAPREGMGLGNTRERLARLYGENQELRLESSSGGGVRAVVRLPFTLESA